MDYKAPERQVDGGSERQEKGDQGEPINMASSSELNRRIMQCESIPELDSLASPSELNGCIMQCESIAELASLVKENLHLFTFINTSTAISRTAKLERTGRAAALILADAILGEKVASQLAEMEPRNHSSILWSYAKLGINPSKDLVPKILAMAKKDMVVFQA
eukprot:gene16473-22695_t